ncbi:MAG: MFS transporter, partial [Neisseriaceae bacterium]
YLSIFITFIVPSAPLLGSFLIHHFKWQATFIFMLIYSIATLICVLIWLKETHNNYHIEKLKPTFIKSTFWTIIKSRNFLSVSFISFFTYGTILAWLTTGPVLLIKYAHITPSSFGWFNFLGCGIAYGVAGRINGTLVKKYGVSKVLIFGLINVLISGILLMASQIILGITFWGIAIPIIILYFGSSFIWPNAFSMAFSPFGHIAGYASAVYSFIQICGGAIIGSMIALLPNHTSTPLAIVIIIAACLAVITQTFNKYNKEAIS